MKKKLATLALCMCAIQSIAADVCAEGDEKCGPDGHVLKCEKLISMDARWRWTPATCKGPAADSAGSSTFNRNDNNNRQVCSEGMSRCGADRKVERCSSGVWRSGSERC